MSRLRIFLSDGGTALRALVRAVVVLTTAFGLKLSGEQVAAIQMATEAALQAAAQITRRY